jgi:hypothetical protein
MIARSPQALLQRALAVVVEPLGTALRRPGARFRWAVVLIAVVLLCSGPAVWAALPVSAPSRTVPQLLDGVRSSASIPFTGYAESRGTLNLPDVSTVGTPVINLLSDRSRMRVWKAGANRFRVDRLTVGAESDTYVSGAISLTWTSDQRTVLRQVAQPQLPLPTPPDVLPDTLGRRLLEALPADGTGVRIAGNDRIAGRAATELRWRPNDAQSLVGDVRIWVDPTNGLPLRVVLRPVGSDLVAFETSYLDLSLTPPDPDSLRFDVGGTQRADVQDALPPSQQDLTPTFQLPATLAGFPQRSPAKPFIATYGRGAALVAAIALDNASADSIRSQLDAPGHPGIRGSFGEGSLVVAPMLRALIFSSGDRGYVLAGTVPLEVLESMAKELVDNPPDRSAP